MYVCIDDVLCCVYARARTHARSVSVYKIVRVDIDNSAQRQAMPVLMENVWKFGNIASNASIHFAVVS